jgi:hypothetical protein
MEALQQVGRRFSVCCHAPNYRQIITQNMSKHRCPSKVDSTLVHLAIAIASASENRRAVAFIAGIALLVSAYTITFTPTTMRYIPMILVPITML